MPRMYSFQVLNLIGYQPRTEREQYMFKPLPTSMYIETADYCSICSNSSITTYYFHNYTSVVKRTYCFPVPIVSREVYSVTLCAPAFHIQTAEYCNANNNSSITTYFITTLRPCQEHIVASFQLLSREVESLTLCATAYISKLLSNVTMQYNSPIIT